MKLLCVRMTIILGCFFVHQLYADTRLRETQSVSAVSYCHFAEHGFVNLIKFNNEWYRGKVISNEATMDNHNAATLLRHNMTLSLLTAASLNAKKIRLWGMLLDEAEVYCGKSIKGHFSYVKNEGHKKGNIIISN